MKDVTQAMTSTRVVLVKTLTQCVFIPSTALPLEFPWYCVDRRDAESFWGGAQSQPPHCIPYGYILDANRHQR